MSEPVMQKMLWDGRVVITTWRLYTSSVQCKMPLQVPLLAAGNSSQKWYNQRGQETAETQHAIAEYEPQPRISHDRLQLPTIP